MLISDCCENISNEIGYCFARLWLIRTDEMCILVLPGSDEERKAVQRAFRFSSRRKHRVYDVPPPDVTFNLQVPDTVVIGNAFTVKVDLRNNSEETRHSTVRLTAVASYYTGVPCEKVGTKAFVEELSPGEGERVVDRLQYFL